uniref:Ribonuclease H protein At1g65750 family n=1 Tax=Cajanus cajan TaxID=3821 RepID=A0A151TEP3_CAJCA|nr:Putative ribonuclease H protein At1g65750 family [Cajanus cajan]
MTNDTCYERGLVTNLSCPICMLDSEDTMHALRDSISAKQVWTTMPGRIYIYHPLDINIQEWLLFHLTRRSLGGGMNWPLTFAITIDALWQRRNKAVFQHSFSSTNQLISIVMNRANSIVNSNSPFDAGDQTGVTNKLRNSNGPPSGYIKLNGDGAVSNAGTSSCGGLVRDSNGRCILAYSRKLDHCSVLKAELWAILQGLRLIHLRSLGSHILIESDSLEAITLLKNGCPRQRDCSYLVQQISELAASCETVSYMHIGREANLVADLLAKHHPLLEENLVVYDSPPSFILPLLTADMADAC